MPEACAVHTMAWTPVEKCSQWIGLALGRGLRGAAHVGVISEFERAGTARHGGGFSAGSIVAAMHALGMTAAEMENCTRLEGA